MVSFAKYEHNAFPGELTRVVCCRSAGISVGSLGQYYGQTDIVENIYSRNVSYNAGDS
jgi:hypothetical protein